jgi:fibronectin-binding autotransporter adhesin
MLTVTDADGAVFQAITVTGGAGGTDGGAGNIGGVGGMATFTLNGGASTGTNLTINGGAAGADGGGGGTSGDGGAAMATIGGSLALTGNVDVADGAGPTDGGNGGEATLVVNGALSLDGNVTGAGGAITINTGGTLTFDGGATAQTASAGITMATANEGIIQTANTAGLTFDGAIGGANRAEAVQIALNNVVTFNGVVTTDDFTVQAAGTNLTFNAAGADQVVIGNAAAGTLTLDDGTINLGGNVCNGDTVFNAEAAVAAVPTNNAAAGGIALNLSANFTAGTIALIDSNAQDLSAGAGLTLAQAFNVSDTALTDFTVQARGGALDILEVTAAARTAQETANLLGISVDDANALRQAVVSTDGANDDDGLDALTAVLNAGGAPATQAARTVGTQEDTLAGGADTGFAAFGDIFSLIGNSGGGSGGFNVNGVNTGLNGFSGGDLIGSGLRPSYAAVPARNGCVWGQAFGGMANADGDTNFEGYDATYGGLIIGVDGAISEDFTLGAFGTYFLSTVDGDGAGNAEIDAHTYGFGVYADYTTADFFLDAFAAYGLTNNDLTRTVTVAGPPAIDRTVTADYDATQFSVGLAGGVPMEVSQDIYITPNASLTYNSYDADSYTETGGGGFSQTVTPDAVTQLTGTIGARIHAVYDNFDRDGTVFIPELRLALIGDLVDDDATASALFTGAGATAYQVTGTDTDDFGALVGVGLGLDNPDWSASLNYDADLRSDSQNHTARAEFRWKF